MKTKTIEIYSFDELGETAQAKVIDTMRDLNTDYEWYDFIYDDVKEIGSMLGIEIDNIYFSGFYSQGDGAQFTGSYAYSKGASKRLRQHAPQDTELHAISDNLQSIQRKHFYALSATVKSTGRYSHEYGTTIAVADDRAYHWNNAEADDSITECLRDFMRWIYSRLESEYEYLTSEEAIRESIQANDYDFYSDGTLA